LSYGHSDHQQGALEGAGFEIVEDVRPSFLLDGSVLVTGEVYPTTPYERGMPG
jgi:7,8-dihydropterin-6-yl-methyl-4-(beta-D-ribofuranosyl)aminobenzene 5'-phosphate synthase